MIAPDYTSITSGLDAAQVVALMIVGGTIVVGVGFGIWTSKSVARFFSGDPMDDKSSPEYRAWYEEKLRQDMERAQQYRREHPEAYRSERVPRASARQQDQARDDAPSGGVGLADVLIADAVVSSVSGPDSSDGGSSDFAGGGGDFGGGGSSGDW